MESSQVPREYPLSADTLVAVSGNQVSTDVGNEFAILNFDSGIYYGLIEVGACVWNFIAEPKTVAQIHQHIQSQYEVDWDQCHQDLLHFLAQLAEAGLVDFYNENFC